MALAVLLDGRRVIAGELSVEVWSAIHRPRRPAQLLCPFCKGRMVAAVRIERYFRHHGQRPADCLAKPTSPRHRAPQELIRRTAAESGWHADVEVPGPGWIADVLVDHEGRRVAIEVQLSPQAPDVAVSRTSRYAAAGIETLWIADRPRPWTKSVLTVLVDDENMVSDSLFRLDELRHRAGDGPPSPWWVIHDVPVPLAGVVRGLLGGSLRSQQVADHGEHVERLVKRSAQDRASELRRARQLWEREEAARQARHAVNTEEWLQRRTTTAALVRQELDGAGMPCAEAAGGAMWGDALLVEVPGGTSPVASYAVCPVAGRIWRGARANLAMPGVVVVVASRGERETIARVAPQATVVVLPGPCRLPLPDRQAVGEAAAAAERAASAARVVAERAAEQLHANLELRRAQILRRLLEHLGLPGGAAGVGVSGEGAPTVSWKANRWVCCPRAAPAEPGDLYAVMSKKDANRARNVGYREGLVLGAPLTLAGAAEFTVSRRERYRPAAPVQVTPADLQHVSANMASWLRRCTDDPVLRRRDDPYVVLTIGQCRIVLRSEDDADPPVEEGEVVVVVAAGAYGGTEPWISAATYAVTAQLHGELRTAPLQDWVFDPTVVFSRTAPRP